MGRHGRVGGVARGAGDGGVHRAGGDRPRPRAAALVLRGLRLGCGARHVGPVRAADRARAQAAVAARARGCGARRPAGPARGAARRALARPAVRGRPLRALVRMAGGVPHGSGGLMDLGLTDRVALVTGGSKGIGFGIAAGLAAEGARVAVAARDPQRVREAAEEIGGHGIVFDSADLDAVPAAIADVESELGPIEVYVANTGGPPAGDDPLGF